MSQQRLERMLARLSERMLYYEDIKEKVVRPRLYTHAKS